MLGNGVARQVRGAMQVVQRGLLIFDVRRREVEFIEQLSQTFHVDVDDGLQKARHLFQPKVGVRLIVSEHDIDRVQGPGGLRE